MKKYFIFTLILSLSMCTLRAQDNIYASLNYTPPAPTEYINSCVYAPSTINFTGEGFSYISAHTTFDYNNGSPSIVLKLVSPNLDRYLESGQNPYHTIELNMPGVKATVNDVVEATDNGHAIAFCGSIDNKAYIGVVDQYLQAIPAHDIQVYELEELFSIVEVPGTGYLACGKIDDRGGIMVTDYNLVPIIGYEYPVILTQVIFDQPNQLVVFCGVDGVSDELSIYNISLNDLLSGNSAVGFTYYPGSFGPISVAFGNLKNVRMSMFDNGYIAISASGHILVPAGNTNNVGYNGLLHVNTLDGQSPITNVVFNWNSDKIHFRDIQTSAQDNILHLLFYHDVSLTSPFYSNPVLIEADINNPASWFGIKIDANKTGATRDYTRMFKRTACGRLGLGGFESNFNITPILSRNHYADIQTLPLHNDWSFELPITNFVFDFPSPVINPAPGFTNTNMFGPVFTYPVTPTNPTIPTLPYVILSGTFINQAQCPPDSPSPSPRSQEIEETNIVVESSAEIRFYEDRAEFSDISGYTQYAVYDMMGRKILDSKLSNNTISFSSMSKGMYILRLLKVDGDSEQHKFIVK